MKVIAVYSIKGGVGKTAASVNLSYESAQEGNLSLLWDLDPQGATTYYLKVHAQQKVKTKKILKGDKSLSKNIRGTEQMRLDVIPADLSYRNLDLWLDDMKRSRKRLKEAIQDLAGEYNFVFLDAPPSINLLAENIFFAADIILVPVIPTVLSMRTLDNLIDFFKKNDLSVKKIHPFFSLADRRKKMHRETMATMAFEKKEKEKEKEKYHFLQTVIPYSSDIEKMGLHQSPTGQYAPKSKGSIAFQNLWQEVKYL